MLDVAHLLDSSRWTRPWRITKLAQLKVWWLWPKMNGSNEKACKAETFFFLNFGGGTMPCISWLIRTDRSIKAVGLITRVDVFLMALEVGFCSYRIEIDHHT